MATMPAFSRYQQPIFNRTSTRTKENQAMNKEPLETTIDKVLKLRQLTENNWFSYDP